jgi:aconitate hydratase
LELLDGQSWQNLGLTGEELYDIEGLDDELQPRSTLQVVATAADGTATKFQARVRIDSSVDLDYYRNGGILQAVLRKMLDEE